MSLIWRMPVHIDTSLEICDTYSTALAPIHTRERGPHFCNTTPRVHHRHCSFYGNVRSLGSQLAHIYIYAYICIAHVCVCMYIYIYQ